VQLQKLHGSEDNIEKSLSHKALKMADEYMPDVSMMDTSK